MKKILLILMLLCTPVFGASEPVLDVSSEIYNDTDDFDGILSSSDETVQDALDTIDDVETVFNDDYLRLDGTNSPTADIDWGGYNLDNVGVLTAGMGSQFGSSTVNFYVSQLDFLFGNNVPILDITTEWTDIFGFRGSLYIFGKDGANPSFNFSAGSGMLSNAGLTYNTTTRLVTFSGSTGTKWKINEGLTLSDTLTIEDLTASSGIYTNASSVITSTPPTSGVLGYWNRIGTVLSPSNSGDDITTTGALGAGAITGTSFNGIVGNTTPAAITGTVVEAGTSLAVTGTGDDGVVVTGIKDEDAMGSDSATHLATQQSIKAYVDSAISGEDFWDRSGIGLIPNTAGDSIGLTGTRISKGWFTDLEVTNAIAGSVTGNAGTATILATARAINGVDFDGSAPITVTAAAGTLTGDTIKSTVTASSLTSLGTIASLVATTADINAGTFDGIVGGTTPAAGAFTTITGSTEVLGNAGTTVTGLNIQQSGVLDNYYYGLKVYSNAVQTNPLSFLSYVRQDNSSSTSGCFKIQNDGSGLGSYVEQVGVLGASKHALLVYSNAVNVNSDSALIKVHQDNASASEPLIETQNDGSGADIEVGGGQIKFPATANPSADANTLDDYEEGTWTPTVKNNSGTATGYSNAVGSYTKIGRKVTVIGAITPIGGTLGNGSTGYVSFSGLPFASASPNGTGIAGNGANLIAGQLAMCTVYGSTLYLSGDINITAGHLCEWSITYNI